MKPGFLLNATEASAVGTDLSEPRSREADGDSNWDPVEEEFQAIYRGDDPVSGGSGHGKPRHQWFLAQWRPCKNGPCCQWLARGRCWFHHAASHATACGSALQHLDRDLKADKEVVLAAVQADGTALQHASNELKADKEVVLAAMHTNGNAIQYASPTLKADKGFALAAVQALNRPKQVAAAVAPAALQFQPDLEASPAGTIRRVEERLSNIKSTMELRFAALETQIGALTPAVAPDFEAAEKRMQSPQEAVDGAALKHLESEVTRMIGMIDTKADDAAWKVAIDALTATVHDLQENVARAMAAISQLQDNGQQAGQHDPASHHTAGQPDVSIVGQIMALQKQFGDLERVVRSYQASMTAAGVGGARADATQLLVPVDSMQTGNSNSGEAQVKMACTTEEQPVQSRDLMHTGYSNLGDAQVDETGDADEQPRARADLERAANEHEDAVFEKAVKTDFSENFGVLLHPSKPPPLSEGRFSTKTVAEKEKRKNMSDDLTEGESCYPAPCMGEAATSIEAKEGHQQRASDDKEETLNRQLQRDHPHIDAAALALIRQSYARTRPAASSSGMAEF